MDIYKDIDGDSGVHSYECGKDYISVKFSIGGTYTYTYQSAKAENVEQMKILARSGNGLNSFINKNVRKLYDKKFKDD